jgi:hypothetical protein
MDYKAAQQVGTLLVSLTQPQSNQLDAELLAKLKGLLRSSDELVEYAEARLMDRLAANNAQVRTYRCCAVGGLQSPLLAACRVILVVILVVVLKCCVACPCNLLPGCTAQLRPARKLAAVSDAGATTPADENLLQST